MRPLPGRSTFSGDGATDCFASQSQCTIPQMSYILADEASVETSLSQSSHLPSRTRDPRKHPIYNLLGDGPAPIRESSTAPLPPPPPPPRSTPTPLQVREAIHHRPTSRSNKSPVRLQTPPPATASQPMTPILYGVSGPCSAVSSSSSRRNSLVGSLSEYQESFVMSAFGTSEHGQPQSAYSGEAAQQFIMPTINVPSRRAFTDVGKSLGRLKLLVAGKSGLGKTSLIGAITHSCQHIVHVDPTVPVAMASAGLLPAVAVPSAPPIAQGTFQITETTASTKPYPTWWKDAIQTSTTSSIGSTEDIVLDRNICLIDTPGYQEACRPFDTVGQVSKYVESHLQKTRFDALDDADALKTISGGGGLLVDAVLYMIPRSGLSSIDVHYIRQLEPLTNVIPILAHADTLSTEQVAESKALVGRQLTEAGIKLFNFASSIIGQETGGVYAISNQLGTDPDAMDASLLMSSEYIQPLVPTDLAYLLDRMFSSDGAAWLRHAAAKKLLRWRSQHPPGGNGSSAFAVPSNSSTERRLLRVGAGSLTPQTTSRVPGYALYEQHLGRVQLTNWAADLQRSLANERAMQERRAQQQAAAWMKEAWRDKGLPSEGTRAPMALMRARGRGERMHSLSRRHSTGSKVDWTLARQQDPLGLLQLNADFPWQTLEMVGGIGILGGLAWLFV